MYELKNIDTIQSHILGVITGLMVSYNLNPAQVQSRYEYILTLPEEAALGKYESPIQQEIDDLGMLPTLPSSPSSASSADDDFHIPIQVRTRREFCSALNNGIKICPRYASCTDHTCNNFHVDQEYICPHVTKGSYCDVNDCELIVIRACRKGKRCNDEDCSFRH